MILSRICTIYNHLNTNDIQVNGISNPSSILQNHANPPVDFKGFRMVRVNLLLSHLHVVNKFMVHVQHRLQNSIAHVTCSCFARPLTPSLRRPSIHAIVFSTAIVFWELGRKPCQHATRGCDNTPLVAVTNVGWRVYTPVFLGVQGNTLRCPRVRLGREKTWIRRIHTFNPVVSTYRKEWIIFYFSQTISMFLHSFVCLSVLFDSLLFTNLNLFVFNPSFVRPQDQYMTLLFKYKRLFAVTPCEILWLQLD